jgi:hypothetical protein
MQRPHPAQQVSRGSKFGKILWGRIEPHGGGVGAMVKIPGCTPSAIARPTIGIF